LEELPNLAEAEQLFSAHQGVFQPRLVVVLIVKIVNLDIRFLWGKILGMLQVIEILANLLGCEQLPDGSRQTPATRQQTRDAAPMLGRS